MGSNSFILTYGFNFGVAYVMQTTMLALQGPHFPDMMRMMQPEHVIALLSLSASIQRCTGIWRLQEVKSKHLILKYLIACLLLIPQVMTSILF